MGGRGVLVLAISFAFILGTMLAGTDGVFATKDDEKKTDNKEKKEKKVIILYKSDKTDKKDEKGKKHKDKEKHVEKLKGKNVKIKHVYDIIPGIAATVDEDSIVDLMNDEDVLAVVEDAEVHATLLNSIPQINADDVHATGITGSGVRVCIIDTGVDDSHPALNPLVDEIDYVNGDSDATDDNFHGTHVAGIIASTDSTYKGVAPGVSLMAAKVLDENGNGFVSGVIAGIQWCVNNNADVINMSLGYGPFAGGLCETTDAVVSNAAVIEHGVVVIASSGNDYDIDAMGSPSCGSDVISVGAVSINDVRASFSNGSPKLDVVAPGVSIQSLNLGGGGYRTLSGTSMAAPHVSGTAALLLQTDSELTPFEIRTILHDSADDLGSDGFDNLYGHGRINAQAAVDLANGIEPLPSTLTLLNDVTGGDCTLIGNWDLPNLTCTLNVDPPIGTSIVIGSDGITIDGNNHNMAGTRSETAVTADPITDATIKNLVITNYSFGIYIKNGDNITITNNEITSTLNFAIYMEGTDNGVMSDNIIFDNSNTAVMFFNSNNNNVIKNNSVIQSSSSGIRITGTNNLVQGNILTDHSTGLRINGNNNQVIGNTMTDNKKGISLIFFLGSNSNILTGNIVQDNLIGIDFGEGQNPHENNVVYDNLIQSNDVGMEIKNANNNQFYNNNFILNPINYAVLSGTDNMFDLALPVGGNFYDNFDEPIEGCVDNPVDGICDAPFVFTGGQDDLPWIEQDLWQNPLPQPPTEEFYNLSKNPDSSTNDREFEKSDIVHILIFSPIVDIENMKKAEFKIEDSNRVKLQGKMTLGPDGIYSASVSLGDLNPGTAKVELKLEDNTRQKFQVKENITILGGLGVEPIPPAPTPPTPTEEFYNLSKNPDFSTEDRDFDTSDIIYMQISSNSVDYSNMKKAEFKIQDSKKVKLQGKMTLGPDGVYSASVSLGDLNPGTAKVELKLEDNTRQKFQVKENITIS